MAFYPTKGGKSEGGVLEKILMIKALSNGSVTSALYDYENQTTDIDSAIGQYTIVFNPSLLKNKKISLVKNAAYTIGVYGAAFEENGTMKNVSSLSSYSLKVSNSSSPGIEESSLCYLTMRKADTNYTMALVISDLS